ncbi:MAG: ABC transporter substrate-binding protein [Halofilum sp. (in: g-proteobacteria)]|nr:ABC transporter substrate-binding protein [Halofilum sp. (in: g-proteobacteria)]
MALPNNVLQISNGSTSPLISVLPEDEGKDLLFRTTAPDTLQGVIDAQLAAGEIIHDYKFKTASTIYVNNPYGQGLSNAFARSFQLRGGTVHAQVPHPEEVQPTYKSQLAAALKDDPDILFCASYPGHTATFLKESRDTFDFTNWLFVDGNKSTKVVEAVGADSLAGSYGTAPGADTSLQAYKDFEAAFSDEYGHDRVPPFTTSAYDAGIVIGLAAGAGRRQRRRARSRGDVLNDHLRPVTNAPGKAVIGGNVDGLVEAHAARSRTARTSTTPAPPARSSSTSGATSRCRSRSGSSPRAARSRPCSCRHRGHHPRAIRADHGSIEGAGPFAASPLFRLGVGP